MKSIFLLTILVLLIATTSDGRMPDVAHLDVSAMLHSIIASQSSNDAKVYLGGVETGANIYPVGQASNSTKILLSIIAGQSSSGAKFYFGNIKTGTNISLREFQCNLISSCGMYPYEEVNNGDGAKVYLGGVRSGETISGIEGSKAVRLVSQN